MQGTNKRAAEAPALLAKQIIAETADAETGTYQVVEALPSTMKMRNSQAL